jgi:hypothetical protein
LVREHDITDTRTVFYDKATCLADYAFVSGTTIKVEALHVDQNSVSDHAALILTVA